MIESVSPPHWIPYCKEASEWSSLCTACQYSLRGLRMCLVPVRSEQQCICWPRGLFLDMMNLWLLFQTSAALDYGRDLAKSLPM